MALLMSPQFPQKFTELVTRCFERHISAEDAMLDTVLHLLLHFCSNCSEEDATLALHDISTSIHLWERSELNFLDFVREAYKITPISVISSIELWASRFLASRIGAVRLGTLKWLQEAVFQSEPLSGNPELDAMRARQVRTLARVCRARVKSAYDKEESRTRHEATITVLQESDIYFKKLQAAGKVASRSSDEATRAAISVPMSIELGELEREIQEMGRFRQLMDVWEVEPPRIASHAVRRSVELESEEETTESDAFEEYEDGSISPR